MEVWFVIVWSWSWHENIFFFFCTEFSVTESFQIDYRHAYAYCSLSAQCSSLVVRCSAFSAHMIKRILCHGMIFNNQHQTLIMMSDAVNEVCRLQWGTVIKLSFVFLNQFLWIIFSSRHWLQNCHLQMFQVSVLGNLMSKFAWQMSSFEHFQCNINYNMMSTGYWTLNTDRLTQSTM